MGQEVGASLIATALTYSSAHLIEEAVLRVDRKATGNRAPHYAPSDMFRCKDGGWIICQAIGSAMFARWARAIDKPELTEDARFQNDLQRGEHGEYFSELMAEWCARFPRGEVLSRLERVRVPAGAVSSPREVLEDEAVAAAGVLHRVEYPGVEGTVPLTVTPVTLSRTPPSIERRPPRTGEHTDEVLREIGYAPERISSLRTLGVI
jgi:formyl-CoA transferase